MTQPLDLDRLRKLHEAATEAIEGEWRAVCYELLAEINEQMPAILTALTEARKLAGELEALVRVQRERAKASRDMIDVGDCDSTEEECLEAEAAATARCAFEVEQLLDDRLKKILG